MKKILLTTILLSLIIMAFANPIVRLKDIAFFAGARDNQLFGIGLVVGLNGTGDSGKLSISMLANVIKKFGIDTTSSDIKSKNVAVVMVTANIPPFYKSGMKLNVTVSAIGDAKSLENGTLLQSPLQAADGNVYAVAQGKVSIGGVVGKKSKVGAQERFKTVGTIINGAIVERPIPATLEKDDKISILLYNPDFTTASRVALSINNETGSKLAKAADASTIKVSVPKVFRDDLVDFLALLEGTKVIPDLPARIIINQKTGTIISGANAKIAPISISYGSINITITDSPSATGTGVIKANTVGDLVKALSALGTKPSDIIAILEAIKSSGALYAEIVEM
jgi:flagellar P-ring protein precursor FlgI